MYILHQLFLSLFTRILDSFGESFNGGKAKSSSYTNYCSTRFTFVWSILHPLTNSTSKNALYMYMYNTFVNSNKCRQQITVLLTVNGALYVLPLENSQNLSATRNSSLWSTLSCVLYMAQMYWLGFVLFYVLHANMIPALWRFELEIVLLIAYPKKRLSMTFRSIKSSWKTRSHITSSV